MIFKSISNIAIAAFLAGSIAFAQTVHQTAEGEEAYGTKGGKALEAGQIETKEVEGATVARVKGEMPQWGFVAYWIGIPAPAGSSTVRFRIYNTAEEKAKYILYIKQGDDQKMLSEVKAPADAPKDAFVDVDIPVESDKEYSGIVLKKASKDDKPGPWIDKVTVLTK